MTIATAIVSAATLAARYLTARRLPDSAVDLIDEAAAAVRVARECQPEIIDSLERKLRQLKIEIHGLSREKDETSENCLDQAKQDASNVEEELRPLHIKYENERKRDNIIQEAKTKPYQFKYEEEEAARIGDIGRVADLKYNVILEQEALIKSLEEEKRLARLNETSADTGGIMAGDIVGPDQIMEIVAKWTDIPFMMLKMA